MQTSYRAGTRNRMTSPACPFHQPSIQYEQANVTVLPPGGISRSFLFPERRWRIWWRYFRVGFPFRVGRASCVEDVPLPSPLPIYRPRLAVSLLGVLGAHIPPDLCWLGTLVAVLVFQSSMIWKKTHSSFQAVRSRSVGSSRLWPGCPSVRRAEGCLDALAQMDAFPSASKSSTPVLPANGSISCISYPLK